MLQSLIEFTLQRRWFVLALAGLMILLGIFALMRLPFDAFPDTTPVMVQVNVSAPGWSPEEVERQITFPVERELSGLSGLTEVRSISKFGLSQVNLVFEDRIDIYLARQQVSERMVSVELPSGVEPPKLGPVSTGLGEVLQYVVISSSPDQTDARTVQDWIIKPQLQSVPGVAEINGWGGFEKQYQILIDPNRIIQYDLHLEEVVEAIGRGIRNVPGGEMVRGGEQTVVQGIGQVSTREEIETLVVKSRKGIPVHLHDIADVVVGHEIRRGASTYQGNGEVVLGLGFMLTGENSRDVTQRLVDRIEEIKPTLPPGVEIRTVYARTELVDKVLDTVKHNLMYGALLVVAVLFAFLGNIRAGLIVASAIPLSMLFAFDLMTRFGVVGSLMSLGAIDFGLAVDNAVIQVENAVSRLSRSNESQSRLDVIRDAILEVRKPTLFGELIIMLVYLPILTLEGVEGKMFRPMALTVIFVLLGSLILSFTVLPALLGAFLKRPKKHAEPRLVIWLQNSYRRALLWTLAHRAAVVTVAVLFLIVGWLQFNRLGSEFVPRLNEGTIAVNFVKLAGISLEQSTQYGNKVEQLIKTRFPDEVDHLWTRTGTAELSTDPMGLEVSDLFITLTPQENWKRAKSQQELVAAIDAEVNDLPGMNRVFTQPIEMRANEMIAGIRADLGIKIFGDDLEELEKKAEEISALVETIPGAADVTIEQLTGQPVFQLAVDRQRISRYDLPASEVLSYIEAIGGIETGEVYEGQRRFNLVVKLDSAYAEVPDDIERIPLQSFNGAQLTLDQVTKPTLSAGPASITREWGKRRAIVQANVRNRDIGSFVDEVRKRVAKEITLPPGYFVQYGGQFENLERAQARLAIVVPLALLLIFGLLYWTYGAVRDAILIFSGVPLAALGGVIALTLRGMPFSISAGVGFITLSGIAVLNGLVLVSSIKRIRSEGGSLETAILESGVSRLRPVMMTALVAAIGFMPMALSSSIGSEVQRPLATVVIGGILTSTALTLFILPVLYSLFGQRSKSEG
jgi:cobalt-zinc-cadmium resistance protein CzcA